MSERHSVIATYVRASSRRRRLLLLLAIWCLIWSMCFLAMGHAQAAGVPVGFADRQVAGGLTSPSAMTITPDGRILVVQQNGEVRIIKGDTLSGTPFYVAREVDSFAERGCLGITTDPNFASNGYVYIFCTVKNNGSSHNRIFRVTAVNDAAAAGSEKTILDLPDVPAGTQWHMGGALRFGPDGKLYVAVGNHEDLREPGEQGNSQNLGNPFGKILRINVDGTIPNDNPFFNNASAYKAIFNLGLRNPFSFDIQRGSGLIYINDVGAGSYEEINAGVAGANYGWPFAEGSSPDPRFTNATYLYSHSEGCAITGGTFYNPPAAQFPASYAGKYFFADFCSGWIRVLDPANPATPAGFATAIGNPVALEIAPDGSLYYLARNQDVGTPTEGAGTVGKIIFTNSQAPRITVHPKSQTIFLGNPVTFTVAADGASGFQWQRNGVDIPGATAGSYTVAATTSGDNQASFTAIARNPSGDTITSAALLTITTNHLPTVSIDLPAAASGFAIGDTIAYSGTASDQEDGALPPSAFTWAIEFQHDTHSHPFQPPASGSASGSFSVPDFESDNANTWFRLYLSVKDSAGQTVVATRDLYPRNQLSDMTPVGAPINGLGPMEKNSSNGGASAGDGRTIGLDGIPYAKGLGVHAPSELRYNLGAACSGNFISDVGVDDEAGNLGSVIFQVFLDGVKVFDSGLMRGSDMRKAVNVSVGGKRELRLVVTDGADGNNADHASWGGARVTGCGQLPLPDGSVAPSENGDPGQGAPGGAMIASPGGGGGCSIGGDGRFDPTLLTLLAAALGMLAWRRRGKRSETTDS